MIGREEAEEHGQASMSTEMRKTTLKRVVFMKVVLNQIKTKPQKINRKNHINLCVQMMMATISINKFVVADQANIITVAMLQGEEDPTLMVMLWGVLIQAVPINR